MLKLFLSFIFFALGVLLNLRPFGLFFQDFYQKLDATSVATLITAASGFTAIWWQTRSNFKHLKHSQEYQFELNRKEFLINEDHIIKNTISAISSELNYVFDKIDDSIKITEMLIDEIDSFISDNIKSSIGIIKPTITGYTYQHLLGNISKLDLEAINTITRIYTFLLQEADSLNLNEVTKDVILIKLKRNREQLIQTKLDIKKLNSQFNLNN